MEADYKMKLDPLTVFETWYQLAVEKSATPETVALATASVDAIPSIRMVYFKGLRSGRFSFVTNYDSRKGHEISENPFVAMTFYWPELDRQIRVEGKCDRMSPEDSQAYFRTRSRESQLSAWASLQSQELPTADAMERRLEEFRKSFEGNEIPCPKNWGGFLIQAHRIEFWLRGEHRRHERKLYILEKDEWRVKALFP